MVPAIWGWGSNLYGQLRQPLDVTDTPEPVHVADGSVAAVYASQIALMGGEVYGLKPRGSDPPHRRSVQCSARRAGSGAMLGRDEARLDAQVGLYREYAEDVLGHVVALDGMPTRPCALTAGDGQAWFFDSVAALERGDGAELGKTLTGQRQRFLGVRAGGNFFLLWALEDGLKMYAFGDNRFAQLDAYSARPFSLEMRRVSFERKLSAPDAPSFVDCADRYAVAVDDNGLAFAWGCIPLCDGDKITTAIAVRPENEDSDVAMVCCGSTHTVLLLDDGSMWGFGSSELPPQRTLTAPDKHGELAMDTARDRIGRIAYEGDEAVVVPERILPYFRRVGRIHAAQWTTYVEVSETCGNMREVAFQS